MNLQELSDEELFRIAGIAPEGDSQPDPNMVAGPGARGKDLSQLSDEELMAIAGGGFDSSRFDMEKGRSDINARMGKPLAKKAKETRRGGRKSPDALGAAGAGYLNWLGMGFADEIVGGIDAGVDYFGGKIPEGRSFSDQWKKRQQEFLDYSDDAWEDHPWAYAGGAIPGFIGSALMTPQLRGATALSSGLKTGALYGGISGLGDGDGAGLNLGSRAKNAAIGAGAGAIVGGAAGKGADWVSEAITGRAMRELGEEAVASRTAADAAQFGLDDTMTFGQKTGNLAAQAKEDMMRKTGYGDEAARVATDHAERQGAAVSRATDDINARLAGNAPSVKHPTEAADMLMRDIRATADDATRQMGSGDAADELLARTAADTIETGVAGGSKKLPEDASSFDLGQIISQGVQSRQAASAAARDAAYETAGKSDGVIKREGVEGMADRIMENLTIGRNLPVIVNERTPAARDALAYLSDVQNFSRPTNKADPLSAKMDPNTVVGITPQGIEQVRKTLVALSQQANAAARTGDASDKFAMRAIMEEFDNELDRIVRYGMFDGDPQWLDLYKHARGLHAQHRRTFRPDDQLKTAMRDIVERDADPSQVANYLIGRNKVGDTRLSRDLAAHLKETLGEGSDEWFATKQGIWQRVVHGQKAGTPEARQITHDTARQIAADIDEFLSNRGRGLAEVAFSDGERQIMARFAQNLRNLSTSRRTPSAALEHMIELADPSRQLQVNELAKMMVGGQNTALSSPTSGRLLDTLLDVYGPDSQQVALVRQAVFRQITTNPEGKNPKSWGTVANNIAELVNGQGRPNAEKLFTPEQLKELSAFGRTLRQIAGNPNAKNHSNTGPTLTRWASENMRRILTGLGAVTGGLDGGVTGFVMGQGAKYVDDSVSGLRAKRLFAGRPDISVSKAIRSGAERVGHKATNKALRYSGQGSGTTMPQVVDRGRAAIAGEDEED